MSVVINSATAGLVSADNAAINVTFPGSQEITITDTSDSIKIGNGSGTYAQVTGANALKVDGSAVTQPISGTVTANTGLSQPLTDTQLRATPVPVSGTLTVTPSGTQDVNVVSSVEIEIKNDSGNPIPVSGTFFQATQPVSAASLPLPTGAATAELQTQPGVDIGDVTINNAGGGAAVNIQDGGNSITIDATNLDVALSTRLKPADTLTAVTTVGTITNVVHVDDNAGSITVDNNGTFAVQAAATLAAETTKVIGTVNVAAAQTIGLAAGTAAIGKLTANSGVVIGDVNAIPPTLTKGTQSATGFSTQDLKDSGRVSVIYYATAVAAGTTTTETAISLTKSSGTGATSSGASQTPTSGKRFRIETINVATRGHNTATAQVTTFNFRINTGGAVTTSSTPVIMAVRSATPATANAWDRAILPIPDGYEILGDGTLQFGVTAAATYTTNAPTWDVTIIGYEY